MTGCVRDFLIQYGMLDPSFDIIAAAERMRREMLRGAVDCLSRVCEAHFSVEEIYIRAMDFGAKESFTRSFCASLFQKQ